MVENGAGVTAAKSGLPSSVDDKENAIDEPVVLNAGDVQGPAASEVTSDGPALTTTNTDLSADPPVVAHGSLIPSATPVISSTAISSTAISSTAMNADKGLEFAPAAEAILRDHCFRCHGENETDEGGFHFAIAREKLVASGFVVPGNPKDSLLFERMVSTSSPMPPEGESPRPTEQEIETVRSWIQSGAKPFTESAPQKITTTDQFYELVARDLRRIPEKDRSYARYFSVTHLGNAGYSEDEIRIYKLALAKLLNSLSWNRKLASLQQLQDLPTVYRIDLRDLKWTHESWNTILADYPFGLVHSGDAAVSIRDATKSQVPFVRADWFISTASRPPLYHVLAQIPETDRKLEQLLQVDVKRNVSETRVIRVGFARSGVSQHNRLIERHESIFGAYWKSYDFAGSTGRKNLFDLPIGPGATATDFDHDGGEVIFQLPNGMLGFMLTDDQGNRIDKGPTSIVSDPRQPDRAVVNGVSCMSCHYGGFIQKTDEIRKHVIANRAAYPKADEILDLYPEAGESSQAISADTKAYLTALADSSIGIEQPTRAGEPIVLASLRYNNELDLPLAAAELGIETRSLVAKLGELSDANLSRRIGSLLSAGGVVKRETFVDSFFQLTSALNLGRRATAGDRGPVAVFPPGVPTAPPQPAAKRIDISALRFGNDANAARQAMEVALRTQGSTKWREAAPFFENAIRRATTPASRLRFCEDAIKFYERAGLTASMLDAYQYILNTCRSGSEARQIRDQLFVSLKKVATKDIPWSRSPAPVKWPISMTRAIASTFEPYLEKYPNHEPSLLVLDSFYGTIRRDSKKHRVVLQRLDKILTSRGESLDSASAIALAKALIESGSGVEGAQLLDRIAKTAFGPQSASLYLTAADSWADLGNKAKATASIRLSIKAWSSARTGSSGRTHVQIGDIYMKLGERNEAAKYYRSALVGQASGYGVEQLQAKLAAAIGEPLPGVKMTLDSSIPAGDATANDRDSNKAFLDPRRKFRIDAEAAEASARRSPTMMTNYMMQAAENWIKAGDTKRAVKAINKAAVANQRSTISRERNFAKLATLSNDAGENQLALDQWVLALKESTTAHQIAGYQAQVDALMQEDPSLTIDEKIRPMLDVGYSLRVQAKHAESSPSYDTNGRVSNLLRAADYWQQAGDKSEVLRCVAMAEKAIGTIVAKARDYRLESTHRKIAEMYGKIEMPKDQVRNLIVVIEHCQSDSTAQREFEGVKLICQTHSLPLPKLDSDTAKKLDPLNRHREQAAGYEENAKENPSSASTYYSMAINSWMRAEETDEAIRVANVWARLALKDKTSRQFEQEIGRLGDVFVKLDRKETAIKCYEEQLKAATSDFRKRSARRKIDALRE